MTVFVGTRVRFLYIVMPFTISFIIARGPHRDDPGKQRQDDQGNDRVHRMSFRHRATVCTCWRCRTDERTTLGRPLDRQSEADGAASPNRAGTLLHDIFSLTNGCPASTSRPSPISALWNSLTDQTGSHLRWRMIYFQIVRRFSSVHGKRPVVHLVAHAHYSRKTQAVSTRYKEQPCPEKASVDSSILSLGTTATISVPMPKTLSLPFTPRPSR